MKTPHLIALVQTWNSTLLPSNENGSGGRDIEIVIARLRDDGKPRNYSHQYEEREDVSGGQYARLWSHKWGNEPVRTGLSTHGPSISFGELNDYVRAAKGMVKVDKALAKMREQRGGCIDASEELSRWLEACGVTEVYQRPEGTREQSWLTSGEWETMTTGIFIAKVRRAMPEHQKSIETTEAAQA